uniref:Uncharacterized protein n=1 Tax=Anguilla anguilla TaxID=7936 RepID=A0A0E9QXD2_ANGAN
MAYCQSLLLTRCFFFLKESVFSCLESF